MAQFIKIFHSYNSQLSWIISELFDFIEWIALNHEYWKLIHIIIKHKGIYYLWYFFLKHTPFNDNVHPKFCTLDDEINEKSIYLNPRE